MKISLETACQLLISGSVVGIPTETVYGLAASLNHSEAIQRIFALKGRPSNNPLIIHVSNTSQVLPYAQALPKNFMQLAESFWPGPLTIVIPISPEMIPTAARAQLTTAAFRIPSHPLARELLQITGPLVMPSANLSGRPSATCREHVEADFGSDFPVLDGGPCQKGVESTILYYLVEQERWQIIRQGALPAEAFEPILHYIPEIHAPSKEQAPLCPGQLYRHYAPKARLKLMETFDPNGRGVMIGFTDKSYPSSYKMLFLGPLANPEKVAENLYAILRQLDQEGIEEAIVDMNFPSDGLWMTIRERLKKAAS